ncbi:MAG: alpha-L-arabinofuranosidase C-terminal domain-containing protein [Phycisphaerae bacterium]
MKRSIAAVLLSAVVAGVCGGAAIAAEPTKATLTIDVNKPGVTIPPTFYGLMTEEINHSYDGGLYAELIQNRTFQDDRKEPRHWSLVGSGKMEMDRTDPVNGALPVSLKLEMGGGATSVANEGYWGIPVRPDTTYKASFYAKAGNGYSGPVTAMIVLDEAKAAGEGKIVASGKTEQVGANWQKYTVELTTGHDVATTAKAKFAVGGSGRGTLWFSNVSLFPPTYEDHANGLRPDLMKLMADLHPAFIRLPGGNYLEGGDFPNRFDWKKMIGPVDERPGHQGCWGYRSSDGFGLPEYLLWCKQLNAEPVLAVFAGYTLNHDHVAAGPKLQPYVEEALEEIEYVTGDGSTKWGAQRVKDGFPEPFKLQYVEVGNEDWFDRSGSYDGRFKQFYNAIKAKYPELKVIATAPVKSCTPDLVDDHYYRSARAMAFDNTHYDKADRNGPQIFCGEWATEEGSPTPDLNAALADAAWQMGLERNADLIPIQCYAPLLVNVNRGAWQWRTNLIGYDALTSFGSPSYYQEKMFGENKGDRVLPVELKVQAKTTPVEELAHGAIGVGTWHTQVEYKDISVTGPAGKILLQADLMKDTSGWTFTGDKWNLQDQVMKPGVGDSEAWAITGDPKWTDYTVTLKARKTGGNEGFIVLWHAIDGQNYHWWNIGGWGNTKTQVEVATEGGRETLGRASKFTVEEGKWYDLKLEVKGPTMKGYIDGKLVTQVKDEAAITQPPVFATAQYITPTHEVVVKVVNMGLDPVEGTLNVRGAKGISGNGKAIVLAGNPKDVNTVDAPLKVSPKEEPLTNAGGMFEREFPAHSLTLLRFGASAE